MCILEQNSYAAINLFNFSNVESIEECKKLFFIYIRKGFNFSTGYIRPQLRSCVGYCFKIFRIFLPAGVLYF